MSKPPILGTVKNSYCFLSDFKFYAFNIFLYLLPAFLVIHAVNFWLGLDLQLHPITPAMLMTMGPGAFLSIYKNIFLAALLSTVISIPVYCAQIIAWHRAYLLGPNESNRVNPLRMTREEWEFLWKYVFYVFLLVVILTVTIGIAIGGALLFGPGKAVSIAVAYLPIFGLIFFVVASIAILRLSFYFPAKATGGYLSFREAFRLSRGLGFRLMVTNVVSWIPIVIFIKIYMAVLPPITLSPMSDVLGVSLYSSATLTSFFVQLPPGLFAGCLALFVTVNNLSQYYRWLEENRMGNVPPEQTAAAAVLPPGF